MLSGEVHGRPVLICHQGALGDLILTLPAIKAIRDHLQPERLEILGHPWNLSLLQTPPYADRIIDINSGEMITLFQEGASLPSRLADYFSQFFTAFIFSHSDTIAENLRRAGVRYTFTLPPFPHRRIHMIDHHLTNLKAIGIPAPFSPPQLWIPAEERRWGGDFLRSKGISGDMIAAIHPGAGGKKKVWPPTHFASLARVLATRGYIPLIIEGPADIDITREVLARVEDIPHIRLRHMAITRVAALISLARLYVGNDSGITHLAAALGVPTLALFGPTDPYVWAPRNANSFWLQGVATCTPCGPEKWRCCAEAICLAGITVAMVISSLVERGWLNEEKKRDRVARNNRFVGLGYYAIKEVSHGREEDRYGDRLFRQDRGCCLQGRG